MVTNPSPVLEVHSWDWRHSGLEQFARAERVLRYLANCGQSSHVGMADDGNPSFHLLISNQPFPETSGREFADLDARLYAGLSQEVIEEHYDDLTDEVLNRKVEIPSDWNEQDAPLVSREVLELMLRYLSTSDFDLLP